MRKYVYENAIVYVTEPTEKQKENIRKATERFVYRLAKEGLVCDDKRRNNNGAGGTGSNARKRTNQASQKNRNDKSISRSL